MFGIGEKFTKEQHQSTSVGRIKKVLIRVLIALPLLVLAYFVFCFADSRCMVCGTNAHVVHNYRETIGMPIRIYSTYENIIATYGEPNDIEYVLKDNGEYAIYVVYDSFTFRMAGVNIEEPETWDYYGAIFADATYKFNNNIHVGVSKEWIIRTYRHQIPVREVELGYIYYESEYIRMVEFTYDENDCVETITFWY